MRSPAAEMALKPGFFNKILVVLGIVHMVAIRHEIAQMLGVFIAFAIMVIRGKIFAHNLPHPIKNELNHLPGQNRRNASNFVLLYQQHGTITRTFF